MRRVNYIEEIACLFMKEGALPQEDHTIAKEQARRLARERQDLCSNCIVQL